MISVSPVSRGRRIFTIHHLPTGTSMQAPALIYFCERAGLDVQKVYSKVSNVIENEVVKFGNWGVAWHYEFAFNAFLEKTGEPLHRADRLFRVRASGNKTESLEKSLVEKCRI